MIEYENTIQNNVRLGNNDIENILIIFRSPMVCFSG